MSETGCRWVRGGGVQVETGRTRVNDVSLGWVEWVTDRRGRIKKTVGEVDGVALLLERDT